MFSFLTGRSVLILHNRSSFVILIGLAFFEPRDYRGVFVIQGNKPGLYNPGLFCYLKERLCRCIGKSAFGHTPGGCCPPADRRPGASLLSAVVLSPLFRSAALIRQKTDKARPRACVRGRASSLSLYRRRSKPRPIVCKTKGVVTRTFPKLAISK